MYKLLIIDDDVMIRNGIKKSISWEQLEISEVITAKSGVEGEEIFRTFLPDIVLTDIRMPKMDGLELLKRVKSIKADVKVIILSGYDDFSYAQTAVKHGAFEYLLKTAGISHMKEVLTRAIDRIKKETDKKEFYAKIRRQLNLSLPLLRYRYLNELLFGFDSTDRIMSQLQFAEIDIRDSVYAVAVMEIDDLALVSEKMTEEERLLLKFSVMNITEELIGDRGLCFESKYEEFVVIYYFDEPEYETNKKDFQEKCEDIGRNIDLYLKVTVSMGLSNSGSGMENIRLCYEDAKKALGHKLFLGKGSIIQFEDIAGCVEEHFFMNIEHERSIISALRVGDRKQLFEIMDGLFAKIGQCRSLNSDTFYMTCVELMGLASRVLCEYGMDLKAVLGKDIIYFEEIKKYKTFDEARKWVTFIFEETVGTILNTRIVKAKNIVEKALKYIDEHYTESIALEKIAEMVYVTPNYLSRLFSSEVGVGFMEYVTMKRLDKAKQLLGEKDSKAFEVGEKVGYDNPQYFSRIFKKYTAMSPIEYKESLRN